MEPIRSAPVRKTTWWVAGLLVLGLSAAADAYELMPTPNLALRAVGTILDIEVEPDGSMIVAGEFDEIGGVQRKNIARILPNGSVDPNWIFDTDKAVLTVARSQSGRIYLGGEFTTINGARFLLKARIESPANGGDVHAWTTNFVGPVRDIEIAGNEDVFTIEGVYPYALLRYPEGGAIPEPNWVASKSLKHPWDLVVSPDGARITTCSSEGEVATLSREGELIWRFNWSGACNEIGSAPDGAVFVSRIRYLPANTFDQVISKFDQNGVLNSNWERISDKSIDAFAFPDNGEVWIGTVETHRSLRRPYSAVSRRGSLVRFSSDGVPLNGQAIETNGAVEVIVPLSGGRAVMAGNFARVNATNRYAWAMVDTSGLSISSMPASPMTSSPRVYDTMKLPDGTTLFSGNFVQIDGQDRRYLARLSKDYTLLPEVWPFEQPITQLEIDAAGRCVAGSLYPATPEFSDQTLLRLEECGVGIDLDWRPAVSDPVIVLAAGIEGDASLYAGICPRFVYSRTEEPCRIEQVSTLDIGNFPVAWSKLLFDDPTEIVVSTSGLFVSRYGSYWPRLLKIADRSTGEFESTWVPNAIVPRDVYGLATYGGHLYVAGDWRFYEPRQDMPTLSRIGLNDGAVDTAWMGWTVSNYFSSIVATKNGFLHAADGASVTRIDVANPGSPSTSTDRMRVSGGQLGRVSLTNDGDLLLTGSFRSVDGVPRIGIARLRDEFGALFVDGFD